MHKRYVKPEKNFSSLNVIDKCLYLLFFKLEIMKWIGILLVGLLVSTSAFTQGGQKRIQVAILFDTSNSMDGLIDQAKSRIWAIVNTLTTLRYQGEVPIIEIALYDYGNDNISSEVNYVRQINSFTTNLDLLSQNLFGLATRGGQEYCGAAIGQALKDLSWTNSPTDLRVIYIAGNEPFNQGKVSYKDVCKLAVSKDIQVNTIYCGEYQQGITEFWYDGAQLGKGEYSNINSNLQVRNYVTPHDELINRYNDSLNRTYMEYGYEGVSMKENQIKQDKNAENMSMSVKAERAAVKSKAAYNNASWDIVDGVNNAKVDLKKLKDEELPEELKGKTEEEKKVIIQQKSEERKKYQQKIGELSQLRNADIEEQKKKESSSTTADFGSEVTKQIINLSSKKGYTIVKE